MLKAQALKYKDTVMVGRTHGVHAEPITFGVKILVWYERSSVILSGSIALENISFGRIQGAVGTYIHLDPQVEVLALKKLGLKPAPVSTQVLQRDRHAEVISVLALICATLDKIAQEIRHLQKTEVLEVEESFTKGQKGSSAMPHKKNPVRCERISGLARIPRGQSAGGPREYPALARTGYLPLLGGTGDLPGQFHHYRLSSGGNSQHSSKIGRVYPGPYAGQYQYHTRTGVFPTGDAGPDQKRNFPEKMPTIWSRETA